MGKINLKFDNPLVNTSTQNFFPINLANKCIGVYFVCLILVSILFTTHTLPLWLWVFGITSVLLFFLGSNYFTRIWYNNSENIFRKNLFGVALIIRLLYVIFIYYFNWEHYGTYYESNEGDITWYVPSAKQMVEQLAEGNFMDVVNMWMSWNVDISDLGYIIYLSILYLITFSFSDVVLPLILKAIYGAITCVLIYRIGKKHFGEYAGRLAAIFCMLHASMIWWCGSMMKETEMILIFTCFIYEMDRVLSLGNLKFQNMIGAILLGLTLFCFRGALGLVAFGSLFLAVMLTSRKVINWSTKIFVGAVVALVLGLSMQEKIIDMTQDISKQISGGEYQAKNMEWRTTRADGNKFAKYASATVFAPLIFTIPFPTMVYTFQGQEMQMMANGGYYIKNILSFWVILVMFLFLITGDWRKHVFILSLLIGYLLSLVLSVFAQSGRFHMPILPLELMFAAYGIHVLYKNKTYQRWFNYALVLEVVFCVAWAWFKLAGRGYI